MSNLERVQSLSEKDLLQSGTGLAILPQTAELTPGELGSKKKTDLLVYSQKEELRDIKVKLIDPYWSSGEIGPHIGLANLASILELNGADVSVSEFCNEDAGKCIYVSDFQKYEQEFIDRVSSESTDSQLIGITCSHENYSRALAVADGCRKANPQALIVLGGSFINMLDKNEALRFSPFQDSKSIDAVVYGEGEKIILPLCQASQKRELLGKIPGISFRENEDELRRNHPDILNRQELSQLPPINWDKFQWNDKRFFI